MAERVHAVTPVAAPEAEAGVRDLAPVEAPGPRTRARGAAAPGDLAPVDVRDRASAAAADLGPDMRDRSPADAADLAPVDVRDRASAAAGDLAPGMRDRSSAAPRDLAPPDVRDRASAAAGDVTLEEGRAQAAALREVVAAAQTATPLEQRTAAQRINALLAALTPGEENGRALLVLLDTAAFTGLVDDAGRECRREAVRALLRLGFPWALEIEPETLAWFREAEARGPGRLRALVVLLAALTALGGGLGWYYLAAPASPPHQVDPGARPPAAGKLQSWEAPSGR